jgi:hypothetical protein
MMYGTLNHEQARFYRDQGYYKLCNAYNQEETAKLREFIQKEDDNLVRIDDQANPNKKMYRLYERNPK